jgi:micrococcal nuclease
VYEYRATVVRVIDGDTIEARIDLGLHVEIETSLRFDGINAPELHKVGGDLNPAGSAARRYLESLLPHTPHGIIVRTRKDKQEKYGRWLAEVVVHHDDPMTVNQRMIEAGHAVEYHGGKR